MNFYITDLIRIIGKKHGLELSDAPHSDLNNMDLDQIPDAFAEDINKIIIPLTSDSSENKIEVDTKQDLYKLIPAEYLDHINPIDDNGEKLLSLEQLHESMKSHTIDIKSINTNEKADIEREKLKASYVQDDYPVYYGLEQSWRLLESDYKVIEREKHPAENPLSSFAYYVEMGFYPPPEIMTVIQTAIMAYFESRGSLSLDQAFFGEQHKKTTSRAYKQHRKSQYGFIEFHLNLNKKLDSENNLSLEKRIEKTIEELGPMRMMMLGFDPEVDIDTFLRGYRRWKRKMKEGKFD